MNSRSNSSLDCTINSSLDCTINSRNNYRVTPDWNPGLTAGLSLGFCPRYTAGIKGMIRWCFTPYLYHLSRINCRIKSRLKSGIKSGISPGLSPGLVPGLADVWLLVCVIYPRDSTAQLCILQYTTLALYNNNNNNNKTTTAAATTTK